jgi:hypothetical protein
MTIVGIAVAVLLGVIANEMSDISPWAARKLVGWSAHLRYGESDRATIRAEEHAALINKRPGKLLKLCTAIGFLSASIASRIRRRITGDPDPEPPVTLDELRRRVLPLEEMASNLVARYLYPTERYRGEWRRHPFQPIVEVGFGMVVGAAAWRVGDLRPQIPDLGLAGREISYSPSMIQIILPVLLWSLWRILAWRLNRFTLTNKRLMVVKGLLVRRVTMASLTNTASLTLRQTPIGRLLNYGTFTLHSVGLLHPLRRIRYLPNANELYLRALEEAFEPRAAEARMSPSWLDEGEEDVSAEMAFAEHRPGAGLSSLLGPSDPDPDGRDEQEDPSMMAEPDEQAPEPVSAADAVRVKRRQSRCS